MGESGINDNSIYSRCIYLPFNTTEQYEQKQQVLVRVSGIGTYLLDKYTALAGNIITVCYLTSISNCIYISGLRGNMRRKETTRGVRAEYSFAINLIPKTSAVRSTDGVVDTQLHTLYST